MRTSVAIEDRALPLTSIDAPEMDVRVDRDPEALDELSRDIGRRGVLHPILVARVADRYEVVDGFTRLLAARRAGLLEIPCRHLSRENRRPRIREIRGQHLPPGDEPVRRGRRAREAVRVRVRPGYRAVVRARQQERNVCEFTPGAAERVWTCSRRCARKQIGIGVAQELNKIPDDKLSRALPRARRAERRDESRRSAVGQQEFKTMFGPTPSPAAEPAAPPAGIADAPHNPFTCEVCGKADNVHLIRQINVHQHCKLAILDPLLANARGEA
jgi:hypothetical protein